MSYFPLTTEQQKWKDTAADIAERELAPRAAETDKLSQYPAESLDVLKSEGMWGLRVSKEHGGLEADLLTTCLIVEELAKKCPSTAMCYKMHLEASEVVCRMPNAFQVENIVKPMANGEVFATVAGSETWRSDDNWTSARGFSAVEKVSGGYRIDNVRKAYVTSAGYATHYFFLCRIGEDTPPGDISPLYVDGSKVDWEILEPWDGLGLRGNESSPMLFNGVVPEEYRLGTEHKGMAEAASFFPSVLGLTYAAAYLGVGSGAFEIARVEADRRYASGSRRLDNPIIQRRLAELSTQIEAAQTMLHAVAASVDNGTLTSQLPVMQAKVFCSETAVRVTQDLMTTFGGTAFAGRLPFERYFRDARAGMIMALANDAAYQGMNPMLFPEKAD